MIQGWLEQGLNRAEVVQRVMEALGVARPQAEFLTALVAGEVDGDVIVVDEQGNEIRDAEPPALLLGEE